MERSGKKYPSICDMRNKKYLKEGKGKTFLHSFFPHNNKKTWFSIWSQSDDVRITKED